MRFEMRTDDVEAMMHIIQVASMQIKSEEPANAAVIRGNLFRLLRKLKLYSLKAFSSRQEFRDQMKKLEDVISSA